VSTNRSPVGGGGGEYSMSTARLVAKWQRSTSKSIIMRCKNIVRRCRVARRYVRAWRDPPRLPPIARPIESPHLPATSRSWPGRPADRLAHRDVTRPGAHARTLAFRRSDSRPRPRLVSSRTGQVLLHSTQRRRARRRCCCCYYWRSVDGPTIDADVRLEPRMAM